MSSPHLQSTPGAPPPYDASTSSRRGRLAISLQEAFTALARLRANKQVAADAESFRGRIKQVLSSAEAEARALGYANDDVRFALFAVIAFLDESVLNSGQAMFSQWPSRTLQEEVFGVHMAGELFFQYLQQLLSRQDSADLADILEVYSLCLLLGYKGRYSATHGGDVQVLIRQLAEKIERIRGKLDHLSPRWRPSQSDIGRKGDRWLRPLLIGAVATALIAVVMFVYFSMSLSSGNNEMRQATTRLSR